MNAYRTALGGLLVIVILAGCGGAAASRSPGEGSSKEPGPTAVPGDPGSGGSGSDPGSGGSGSGSGGGSGGSTGSGVVNPGSADVPPPVPGGDGATIVVPKPGQLDPKPVSVSNLLVIVDGRHVTARLAWTSGVEPCYVLDSVRIARDGNTITLTVLEGHGPGDVVCIEIAQLKATLVDLGELEPGSYDIQVQPGDAPAVTVDIE